MSENWEIQIYVQQQLTVNTAGGAKMRMRRAVTG